MKNEVKKEALAGKQGTSGGGVKSIIDNQDNTPKPEVCQTEAPECFEITREYPNREIEDRFLRIPNLYFDQLMRYCGPSAFCVLMAIYRNTRGWNVKAKAISYSQIQDLTGLSRGAVYYALQFLEGKPDPHKPDEAPPPYVLVKSLHRPGRETIYKLNPDFYLDVIKPVKGNNNDDWETEPEADAQADPETEAPEPVQEMNGIPQNPEPVQKMNDTRSKNERVPVQKMNPLKTSLNDTSFKDNKDDDDEKPEKPDGPPSVDFADQLLEAWKQETGNSAKRTPELENMARELQQAGANIEHFRTAIKRQAEKGNRKLYNPARLKNWVYGVIEDQQAQEYKARLNTPTKGGANKRTGQDYKNAWGALAYQYATT